MHVQNIGYMGDASLLDAAQPTEGGAVGGADPNAGAFSIVSINSHSSTEEIPLASNSDIVLTTNAEGTQNQRPKDSKKRSSKKKGKEQKQM